MPLYTQESLEKLREKIDLVEVISGHLDLKKAGVAYKALCPFHEEKTPSFTLQKGDTHYHCFGCGAHGDAITFLMTHLRLSFGEAVESLSEKFQVPLQLVDKKEEKGVDKSILREALEIASDFYHFYLLHTEEGREPLNYLCNRGISLDFIYRFELGYAPKESGLLKKLLASKKISDEIALQAGLLRKESKKEFFHERITFPIRNPMGSVIGFSARKYKEETFGGKYINTPETPLFKKSRTLFGLNYCRERIAKERRAIIVEGQIDCLKMIEAGFNLTVASLGTAFGQEHVRDLTQLGVHKVFLLFDGDSAGQTASSKVGDLFQKAGVEVKVTDLPKGSDPDSFLAKNDPEKLRELLLNGQDYLNFQVAMLAKECDLNSPAGKAELIKRMTEQIRQWEDPVMVHESLRKVAQITLVPEEVVGVGSAPKPTKFTSDSPGFDPERILEMDLLRWLLLTGHEEKQVVSYCQEKLTKEHFQNAFCKMVFEVYMKKRPNDLLELSSQIQDPNFEPFLTEILNKKINREKALEQCLQTIQKLLDRAWLLEREQIKAQIAHSTSPEEKLELIKKFDAKARPNA